MARQVLTGILAIVATAPAYVLGRFVAYFFQGAHGGNFIGQMFWEFTAGGFAAAGAYFVIDWLIEDVPTKRSTHLVVITIVLTVLGLLAAIGIFLGYEYNGSSWEAAGGLLGLLIGFLFASLVVRGQLN
jgi:hypothetical protein